MEDHDGIDIGLCIIKRCGMYSTECKKWIAGENESLPIVETIESFKGYWTKAIVLVNQMAIPAANHGYGMAAVDNNALLALCRKLLANFGAAYPINQSQATSLAAMQGQLVSRPTSL